MHRRSIPLVVAAMLLTASLTTGLFRASSVAQETASPEAPASGGAVGVVIEPLGRGSPDSAPGHDLSLLRVTFEPGGSIARHHHPGALVLTVEAGTLGYTLEEGQASIARATTDGTPGPVEPLTPGVEATLTAGDSLFEQGVVHSARNAGDEPAVVWIAGLMEAGQPFTIFHEE